MQNGNPLVTAVIPTRNRPELVGRAVRSALAQTYTNVEVIVVVDGPDPATVSALEAMQAADARLRILALPRSVGACDTRNAGIQAAKGEWIALLDDDDEWMPEKLEKQIALGLSSSHRFPVLASKVIWRSPAREYVWPRATPFLPIGDFLMRRTEFSQGEATIQTSTLVVPTALFRSCLFTSGLPRYQDTDWLIRAFDLPGVGLEFLPEPLSIWHVDNSRPSISANSDWHASLKWISQVRSYLSAESYASFVLVYVGATASVQSDWRAFFSLLMLAFRNGKPRTIHLLIYLVRWLFPRNLRLSVRAIFERLQKRPESAAGVT